jgi:hypothetical protein
MLNVAAPVEQVGTATLMQSTQTPSTKRNRGPLRVVL